MEAVALAKVSGIYWDIWGTTVPLQNDHFEDKK